MQYNPKTLLQFNDFFPLRKKESITEYSLDLCFNLLKKNGEFLTFVWNLKQILAPRNMNEAMKQIYCFHCKLPKTAG